jgi:hypothetical protein
MKLKTRSGAIGLMLIAALQVGAIAANSDPASDKLAIQQIMRGTWDKPEAPLRIEPIVAVSDYAIAGWTQGDMGGRALLRKKAGEWVIVLCSGDALKSAEILTKAAVPATIAATLAKELNDAEHRLDPALVAQFARFEGLVMMDQAGNHPHHK